MYDLKRAYAMWRVNPCGAEATEYLIKCVQHTVNSNKMYAKFRKP